MLATTSTKMPDQTKAPLTISVIIPTHNRAKTISRAVHSVLIQKYRNMEVIVVDDASTDDTEQVIAALGDPSIRYIKLDRNQGAPRARNVGIEVAKGNLIAFQDSDDEWLPGKLEKQIGLFVKGGQAVNVAYTGILRCTEGLEIYIPEPWVTPREGDISLELLHRNFVSTQTLLVRRECFEKAGFFDERLGRFQDWDIAIRLAQTYQFHLVDEPLVRVHYTPGNISSNDVAAANALEIIIDKNRTLLMQHPSNHASMISNLANYRCRTGDMMRGRRLFLQALKLHPLGLNVLLALFLSLLGRWVYCQAEEARRSWRTRSAKSKSTHRSS